MFYPPGLAHRRELEFASRMFPSIEINGSFYALQPPASWQAWRDATPPGFVFSIKGPRYLTHVRRLREVQAPLANFLASGILDLGDQLGPLLWQFPPNFRFDAERFDAFFRLLPKDTHAARHLARRHGDRPAGGTSFGDGACRPLRHAFEVRHDSFIDPVFIAMLRRHGHALVVADTGGRYPAQEDLTADFVYVRLHGPEALYASGYTDTGLDHWAHRLRTWEAGGQVPDARLTAPHSMAASARDVYCYFDNDQKVHAPFDAARLTVQLGQPDARGAGGGFAFASSPLARPTPER